MRLSSPLIAAALALTACAPPKPPVDLADVSAGLDAYRTGDFTALEQRIAAITPRATPGSPPPAPCSSEGYALRRSERAKRWLGYLSQGPNSGSAAPVRYVYMEGLITGGEARGVNDVGGPTDFECEGDKDYVSSHKADDTQFYAIRDATRDHVRDWYGELHTALGDQFELQMNAAAAQLHAMGLRTADRWEAPNTIR